MKEELLDDDEPITLAYAAKIVGCPVSRLRVQSQNRRLFIFRIGRRLYTTKKHLRAMLRPHCPVGSNEVVYFIECGDFVKIGRTNNIDQRFDTITRSMPGFPELVGTIPGNHVTEYDLHTRFFSAHHKNEWFHKTSAVAEFLEEVAILWEAAR